MSTKGDPAAVQAYIAAQPKDLQDILRAARQAVREAAPHAVEAVKWNAPAYVGHGIIVAIPAFSGHVNLQFHRGAELPDPDGLLEGSGKGLRHVKLRHARQVKTPAVKALLRAAVRLDREGMAG